MKLYIANPTQQIHEFTYNAPDDDRGDLRRSRLPRTQKVYPGQQTQITGDWSRPQIDNIIDQHAKYGLVSAEEAERARDHVGIVYSIDKPVSAVRIGTLMQRNLGFLDIRGRKMRELAAVSVNNGIETQMHEKQMPGRLQKVEMEMTEIRTSRSDSEETEPQLIRVTRDGDTAPETRSRRRRAA